MTTFKISPEQSLAAEKVAAAALQFEKSVDFPLGVAIVEYHFADGSADAVIDALAAFQNEDGGFGKGLEVDITSPTSNPFAARLAMSVLLSLHEIPKHQLVDRLGTWLNANQSEDGDWHFSEATKAAPLAPWFAGWTFPSLNPACCLSGLGKALGLLTEESLARTTGLFDETASIDSARTADFYGLLPYTEFFRTEGHFQRDAYLDAIAENIANAEYDDAGHFFDHALGNGPDLIKRLGSDLISRYADQLLAEPVADGGWPNPYSESWRPFATAGAVMTLAKLRDGV